MDPLSYLAHVLIDPVKKKGWLSDDYILLADYFSQAQLLYEIGAVLGYSYRDKLESFAAVASFVEVEIDWTGFRQNITNKKEFPICLVAKNPLRREVAKRLADATKLLLLKPQSLE